MKERLYLLYNFEGVSYDFIDRTCGLYYFTLYSLLDKFRYFNYCKYFF